MKQAISFLICICALSACNSNPKNQAAEQINISRVELTEKEKSNIDALKRFIDTVTVFTRAEDYSNDRVIATIKNIDNYKLSVLPLRVLNEEMFIKDPTLENFMASIYCPEDVMMIAGKDKEENDFMMIINAYEEDDNYWAPQMATDEYEKSIAWLKSVLAEADNPEYVLFQFYAQQIFITHKDKKPVLHSAAGEELEPEAFISYVKSVIQNRTDAVGDYKKMTLG